MLHSVARSNLIVGVLLLGALVAAFGSAWVLRAARHRDEWQATKALLEVKQAPRTTEYPGVTAWLWQLMRRQCEAEPSADDQADCVNVLRPGTIPARLKPLEAFLAPAPLSIKAALLLDARRAGRLCIAELEVNDHRYVATRPALDSNCQVPPAGPLLDQAIAVLDARRVPGPMAVEPFGNMEPVRAYVMAQDGTLISRRFSDRHLPRERRGVEYQEFARTAENLAAPSVTAVNSFFPLVKRAGYAYTGTYADVAGLGVVATGMTQMALPGFGDVVVAIDVALGIDWIQNIIVERPKLLPLDLPADGKSSPSWEWVADQAAARGADDLARLARRCSGLQREFDTVAACSPDDESEGALLAATLIGVSSEGPPVARWLIAWMSPLRPSFEIAQHLPAILLAFAALAYASRDRQYRALSSESASQTRQWSQFVDSLGTALIVIDPNTDRVRFRNASAQQLGIEVNQIFRELVADEDRRLYDQSNLASGTAERAYAVRVQSTAPAQWAIVRSTALATALPVLGARESDRLGLMSLLTATEIERLQTSLELSAVQEERGKLSSLITHGVAHLARLMASDRALDERLRGWLGPYLMRRVSVLADLLSGWALPLDEVRRDELAVAKQSVHATLEAFQRLATTVAANRELRKSLQWSNGVLSRLAPDTAPFHFDLQGWPDDLHLTIRIEGAETFILDELLVNTFKHGKPGCPPALIARVVRGADRRWIEFELRNEVRSTREVRIAGADHRYGGETLVEEACRRLRWEFLPPALHGEIYVVRWRARTIEAAED